MAENMTNLPPEYIAQLAAVDRQRKLAQLLQTQAMGFKGAQSQGPVAAKTSPLAWLANAAAGSLGTEIDSRGIKSAGDIVANAGVERQTELDNLLKAPEAEQFGMGARAKFSQNQDIAKALQSQAKDRQAQRDKRFDTAMTGVGKTDPNAMLKMAQTGEFAGAPVAEPTIAVNGQVVPANKQRDYRTQFGTPLKLGGDLYQVAAGTGEYKKLDNAPKVSVSNSNYNAAPKGEEAFTKALGGDVAGEFKQSRTDATMAYKTGGLVNQMRELDAKGVFSGPSANLTTVVAAFADELNLPVDQAKLANSEAFRQQFAKQIAGFMLQGSVGRSMTDADRKRFEESFPSLLQSPMGRQQIYKLLEKESIAAIRRHKSFQGQLLNAYPEHRGMLTLNPVDDEPGRGVTPAVPEIVPGMVNPAKPAIRVWDQATGTWKKGT